MVRTKKPKLLQQKWVQHGLCGQDFLHKVRLRVINCLPRRGISDHVTLFSYLKHRVSRPIKSGNLRIQIFQEMEASFSI